jgi:transglutaminase/protease-like cytokinesis protein 3
MKTLTTEQLFFFLFFFFFLCYTRTGTQRRVSVLKRGMSVTNLLSVRNRSKSNHSKTATLRSTTSGEYVNNGSGRSSSGLYLTIETKDSATRIKSKFSFENRNRWSSRGSEEFHDEVRIESRVDDVLGDTESIDVYVSGDDSSGDEMEDLLVVDGDEGSEIVF